MSNRRTWKEILISGLDDDLVAIKINDTLYIDESLENGLDILDKYTYHSSCIFTAWDKQTVHFIVNDSDEGNYIECAPRNPPIKS